MKIRHRLALDHDAAWGKVVAGRQALPLDMEAESEERWRDTSGSLPDVSEYRHGVSRHRSSELRLARHT